MLRNSLGWMVFALISCTVTVRGADGKYEADIAQWRLDRDRDLRSEKGPLYTIGRYRVAEGRMWLGSSPECHVVLPDRAPKRVGMVERHEDKVTFEPASGAMVTMKGKPVTDAIVLRTAMATDREDTLEFGDFSIGVRLAGGNYLLSVRDRHSHILTEFRASVWYPPDAAYRVEATFTPYAEQKTMQVLDTTEGAREMPTPGYVTFRLGGEELCLEAALSGGKLFFMFKDQTSAKETYGVGRFLSAELPRDGKTILDFNKADNPLCAYNPYVSCPIPPKQNYLPVRIEAGERYARGH
jgi:uncharacterized protein (DUF1684 family)